MARGDMRVENATFGSGAEILNRPPFKGVSMTIDFSTSGYATENGVKVMKAGMPITKDGKAVKTSPFKDAVGILLTDVTENRPQGTILTEAYINKDRAEKSFGGTYDSKLIVALVNAGCRIRIEGDAGDNIVIGDIQPGE